jgi:hypothetical protein
MMPRERKSEPTTAGIMANEDAAVDHMSKDLQASRGG